MMRAKIVTAVLLVGVLAACGPAQDDSGDMMMDDDSGMMDEPTMTDDSPQMGDPMGSERMGEPEGAGDSLSTGEMRDDDSSMMRDTSEMRRP